MQKLKEIAWAWWDAKILEHGGVKMGFVITAAIGLIGMLLRATLFGK